MKLLSYFNKPEYFYRIKGLIVYSSLLFKRENVNIIKLPWGTKFKVYCKDTISNALIKTGIYDLALSEVAWRILNTGSIALDIGANIGYVSSLMGKKVGSSGCVYSFEPHPELYKTLVENSEFLNSEFGHEVIRPLNLAVSSQAGEVDLFVPSNFNENRGVSSLEYNEDTQDKIKVKTIALDQYFSENINIQLLKIDVEGHEISVLRGAKRLLTEGSIANIVYEDHIGRNSEVHELFISCGYTIFRIIKSFRYVKLIEGRLDSNQDGFEAPNFLATRDPEQIKKIFSIKGWNCLREDSL